MKTYKEFLTESAQKMGKFAIKSEFGGWTDWKFDSTSSDGLSNFVAGKVSKAISKGSSSKETAFTTGTIYDMNGIKRSDFKSAFKITQVISDDVALIELIPNYTKGHYSSVRTSGIVVGKKFYTKDKVPSEYKKYF